MKNVLKSVLVLLAVLAGTPAAAQVATIDDTLVVTITPENPEPRQNVSIRIEDYNVNLDSSMVNWSLNGKVLEQGRGKKTAEFRTGAAGARNIVDILITTPEGNIMRKTLDIRTGSVDLVYEALSYVPPFYKGKGLPSYGSLVKVTAIPDVKDDSGADVKPSNLIYKWKKNGKVMGDASGYGKQSFVSEGDSYVRSSDTVSVEVSTVSGAIVAGKTADIKKYPAETAFYQYDLGLGTLWNKALTGSFDLSVDEFRLYAEPFYMSTDKRGNGLKYSWIGNGVPLSETEDTGIITLRRNSETPGSSIIRTTVSNPAKTLQQASAGLLINYSAKESTGEAFTF